MQRCLCPYKDKGTKERTYKRCLPQTLFQQDLSALISKLHSHENDQGLNFEKTIFGRTS